MEDGLLLSGVDAEADDWDGIAGRAGGDDGALYLALEGWEGPLDLLLDLARRQKVDLRAISILALVDQYLGYIDRAEALKLELAADYLYIRRTSGCEKFLGRHREPLRGTLADGA